MFTEKHFQGLGSEEIIRKCMGRVVARLHDPGSRTRHVLSPKPHTEPQLPIPFRIPSATQPLAEPNYQRPPPDPRHCPITFRTPSANPITQRRAEPHHQPTPLRIPPAILTPNATTQTQFEPHHSKPLRYQKLTPLRILPPSTTT